MSAYSSLYKLAAIIEIEIRKLNHDKTEVLTRTVQPILWLLIFGEVFTAYKAIPTGSYTYLQFVAPGILGQSVLFTSIFFGITMVWDRESGTLSKILVSPVSRISIMLGKALSAGVRSIMQAILLLIVSLLVGIQFYPNLIYTLAIFPVLVLMSALFASISMVLASQFKTRERVMGLGQLITMPLFFTSNALYPISIMPPWLQVISYLNPLTYGINLLRSLLLTGSLTDIWTDLAVLLAYLAVFTIVGAKLLNKIME